MIYSRIDARVCIARIYDRFPVKSTAWEDACIRFVYSATRQLAIPSVYPIISATLTTVDNVAALPDGLESIYCVSVNGSRIESIDAGNFKAAADVANVIEHNAQGVSYGLNNNGEIMFVGTAKFIDEADKKIYYYASNSDGERSVTDTMYIPNNEELLEYLDWYILLRIMQKGTKIEGYGFSVNEYTNPAIQVKIAAKSARNSLSKLDRDAMYRVMVQKTSMLNSMDRYFITDYIDTRSE